MAPKRTEIPIIFDEFRIRSLIMILLHCASLLSSRDASVLWSHSNFPASIKLSRVLIWFCYSCSALGKGWNAHWQHIQHICNQQSIYQTKLACENKQLSTSYPEDFLLHFKLSTLILISIANLFFLQEGTISVSWFFSFLILSYAWSCTTLVACHCKENRFQTENLAGLLHMYCAISIMKCLKLQNLRTSIFYWKYALHVQENNYFWSLKNMGLHWKKEKKKGGDWFGIDIWEITYYLVSCQHSHGGHKNYLIN